MILQNLGYKLKIHLNILITNFLTQNITHYSITNTSLTEMPLLLRELIQ